MAKINHLDMGAEVLALNDVQVKKGFMGLTYTSNMHLFGSSCQR